MRIRDLIEDRQSGDELLSHLLTVLEFLRNRAHNKQLIPTISTMGLLNMVNNSMGTSTQISYDTLVGLYEKDPAVKNVIDKLDRDQVKLKPFGDEPGLPDEEPVGGEGSGGSKAKDPTKTVDAMAKRASQQRS
jgi:hypothetical protein